MPIDPVTGMMIAQGATQLMNAGSQAITNNRQKRYALEMYERQRRDALADWEMQAAYNSPKAQMERYAEAGLNKNLIYGSGTSATMDSPRSSNPGSYNPQAPQIDSSFITSIYDLKLKEAQADNVKAATQVQNIEALNKLFDVSGKEFDLGLKKELRSTSVEMANQLLTKARADADKAWSEANIKDAEAFWSEETAKATMERMINESHISEHQKNIAKKNLELMEKDGQLKDFEIKLNKMNITKSDPVYIRLIQLILGKLGIKK